MSEILDAIEDDPIAIIVSIVMIAVLIFWLGTASSFNPINSNVQASSQGNTITQNYALAYNDIKWFLILVFPLGLYIIPHSLNRRMNREEGEAEDA
jgi:hypothetical protein